MPLIDTSGLARVATDDNGLMDQPAEPKFKVGLVECYNKNHTTGGSDKLTNKHRFDSVPISNGVIKAGMSCQIIEYHHEEHDKFMAVVKQFDAVIVRCNPGHIDGDGGSQQKFDKDMQALAATKPVWPTADVMTLMGAKDALVKIKDMDFGLVDTLGYYSPDDMKAGFPKAIAFQPRVVKQNRGSAGEGIWIIKRKSGKYCDKYCDEIAAGDEMLILKEANDNHIEEHTVDEFIDFCENGRTDKSGEWKSQGTGKYFEGGAEAGGQMVDQRFVSTIDEKGESRFFMCGMDLYNVEHYMYIGGVGGETKTTVYMADAPEYAETRKKLEEGIPEYMKALGLDMSQLPLLWAADFLTTEDGSSKIGEFNCSCLGVTGFLDARGKDMSACKPEDIERGQAMCDHIGRVALKALENRALPRLRLVYFPVRARGEPIRMLLRHAGVPYEDVTHTDYFGASWSEGGKAGAPFGSLPLLIVDDQPPLAQTGSIMRYLAALTSLAPADPLEAARCDAIFEVAAELMTGPTNVNPIVNVFKGDQWKEKRATFFELAPAKIANLEKAFIGEGPFFLGAAPLYPDFAVYHVLSNVLLLEASALETHPRLQGLMAAVGALPAVKAYLDERPDVEGIGVAPRLRPKAG